MKIVIPKEIAEWIATLPAKNQQIETEIAVRNLRRISNALNRKETK